MSLANYFSSLSNFDGDGQKLAHCEREAISEA